MYRKQGRRERPVSMASSTERAHSVVFIHLLPLGRLILSTIAADSTSKKLQKSKEESVAPAASSVMHQHHQQFERHAVICALIHLRYTVALSIHACQSGAWAFTHTEPLIHIFRPQAYREQASVRSKPPCPASAFSLTCRKCDASVSPGDKYNPSPLGIVGPSESETPA